MVILTTVFVTDAFVMFATWMRHAQHVTVIRLDTLDVTCLKDKK